MPNQAFRGRAYTKQAFHFPECTENFKAYKVTGHQHIPEIEQGLSRAAGHPVNTAFTPHLVPMIRGILSTIYVRLKPGTTETLISEIYQEYYKDEPFIRLLPPPELPETKMSAALISVILLLALTGAQAA